MGAYISNKSPVNSNLGSKKENCILEDARRVMAALVQEVRALDRKGGSIPNAAARFG